MSELSFMDKLQKQWDAGKFLCIGLDAVVDKMSSGSSGKFWSEKTRLKNYTSDIIFATEHIAAAYKINPAFLLTCFEPFGEETISEYLVRYLRWKKEKSGLDIPIILDAKYGDVAHSNELYAQFAFDKVGVDAVTVNPYVGFDALAPFYEYTDKGTFVLCHTSNPATNSLQERQVDISEDEARGWDIYTRFGENIQYNPDGHQTVSRMPGTTSMPLYELVARKVNGLANSNLGLVVGGTDSGVIANVRDIDPDLPLLIPGIGAQGGDLESCVQAAANSNGQGFLVSASRSIIYASRGKDYAEAARLAASDLHQQIITALH